MSAHTEACRHHCGDNGTEYLLHEILERMDRLEATTAPLLSTAATLIGKRLSKMALLKAGGKLSAEWKNTDERD
jgi:hypothetical protein